MMIPIDWWDAVRIAFGAGIVWANWGVTGFNIGAIYDFDDHNHLLVSAGRALQNASETNLYSWYLGYQITGP